VSEHDDVGGDVAAALAISESSEVVTSSALAIESGITKFRSCQQDA
jgi:hypothetical protein